jgi:hypothetical protein
LLVGFLFITGVFIMAIVQTVNFSMFCDMFTHMGRQEQFSYEAKKAIFDYLESYSDECGEPVELDVIAICCDYSEDSAEDIVNNQGISIEREDHETNEDWSERICEEVRVFLEYHSTIISEKNGVFVYQQF